MAIAILSSSEVFVTPGLVNSSETEATPSGRAKAVNSSSVANRALSRASA